MFLAWTHLSESVQERLGQTFTATALLQRVLAGKNTRAILLDLKGLAQLWNKHLSWEKDREREREREKRRERESVAAGSLTS